MAAKTQDVLYNITGQSVYWDCPEGRPSSVTATKLYLAGTGDDGTAETALDTPTVETNPNTTLDGAAGVSQSDPTLIPLTATTGCTLGRRFLMTNANGEIDWVEIGEVNSGVAVYAKEPLRNDYVSGDSFESTRITAAILAAWVGDSSNISDDLDPNPGYRLRAVYVVGGVTYVHQCGVNLVRYRATHTVTPADMQAFRPAWANVLPTYHQQDGGARILDEAYTEMRWDWFRAGVPAEMVRNQEAVDQGTKLMAWMNITADGNDEAEQAEAAKRYTQFVDGLFRITATAARATSTSGAGVVSPAGSLLEK